MLHTQILHTSCMGCPLCNLKKSPPRQSLNQSSSSTADKPLCHLLPQDSLLLSQTHWHSLFDTSVHLLHQRTLTPDAQMMRSMHMRRPRELIQRMCSPPGHCRPRSKHTTNRPCTPLHHRHQNIHSCQWLSSRWLSNSRDW